MSVIIGLDLAERTGICVLRISDGALLWSASVKLAHRDSAERLLALQTLLQEVIARFPAGEMAIEDVFLPVKTSPRTPISLGELRGVARLCAAQAEFPVFFYSPRSVKQAITGSGKAEKEDVMRWVEMEFSVKVSDNNESDAISVAYTHWLTRKFHS